MSATVILILAGIMTAGILLCLLRLLNYRL